MVAARSLLGPILVGHTPIAQRQAARPWGPAAGARLGWQARVAGLHVHHHPPAQEPAGPLRVGLFVGTPGWPAELCTEGSLEAPTEVLVEVAVDDGVGAAVEEGQPVCQGEGVDRQQVQLRLAQLPVVDEQQQRPERQPGQREEECHHDQHVHHADPAARRAATLSHCLLRVSRWTRGLAQLARDARVHHDDERQWRQVDVCKEHGGVDLTHTLLRPGLPAGVERVGAVASIQHEVMFLARDGQSDRRGTHDEQSQSPDHCDGEQRLPESQLLAERVNDAAEPAAPGREERWGWGGRGVGKVPGGLVGPELTWLGAAVRGHLTFITILEVASGAAGRYLTYITTLKAASGDSSGTNQVNLQVNWFVIC